jgi:hypothetical protein
MTIPDLPYDIIAHIVSFSGFREMFLLRLLVPEICCSQYLCELKSKSLESAIDKGQVYEILHSLWGTEKQPFYHSILFARAIRKKKWKIVYFFISVFKIQPKPWNIMKSIELGVTPFLLRCMLSTYQEPILEKLRPACLIQAEIYNNSSIFLYIIKECDFQRRRKGTIRKIIRFVEEKKWESILVC